MSTMPQPPAWFPSERLSQVPSRAPAPKRHNREVVPFRAADGFKLKLVHVWGDTPPTRGPVILIHGAGVRSSIFEAPVKTTVVDALVEHGYDVWLEDWRASIDLPPNRWTLDQAAVLDHPMAVREIVKRTGASEIKALTHCQGSTSFFMSAWAGLVPEVSVIVSNAVSLHTVIPRFSTFKIRVCLPIIGRFTDYLNPRWGIYAPTRTAKALARLTEATHHECDNPVCHGVSFTYGSGFPALWSHAHLSEETHEWLTVEFAHVPTSFFRQMARCVQRGSLVSVDQRSELPSDFEKAEPRTDAVFALFAGDQNRCFLPVGQERTYDVLNRHHPGRHSYHRLENYGHLDVFMGNDAARDVFPHMIAALGQ